jgi:uncharacterized tellurite resistance protein B-like protein
MFKSIRQFFSEFADGERPPARFDEDDSRLATAVLLVHAATIDGNISELERRNLSDILRRRFALDAAPVDELVALATQAEREAVDLYRFTRVLNRSLAEPERCRMVEMLWEIVYADGNVTEFEDNLIWRVADLLGISANERIALRQRVAASRGQ